MSGRDRGDRGALVALAIIVFGAVVVAWLGNPPNQIVENNTQPNSGGNDGQRQAIEQAVYFGIFTTRDTFAQWIAAVAAIGSVGVSIWAVGLVRKSLKETRRATDAALVAYRDTREIGEAQARAYLGCIDAEYRVFKDRVEVWVRIKNHGNSPATNIRLKGHIQTTNFTMLLSGSKGQANFRTQFSDGHAPSMAGGNEGKGFLLWMLGISDSDENDPAVECLIAESTKPNVSCTVTWVDVFMKENVVSFYLTVEHKDLPESAPRQIGKGSLLKPYHT